MKQDSTKMRGERHSVFSTLYDGGGLEKIVSFIVEPGMLQERWLERLSETA
jgi:hypothetical protein